MKYKVIIQPPAAEDIEAAYLYLRDRSVPAANRWLDGLEQAVQSLDQLPNRCGLARESIDVGEEIRQLLYGRRRGIYRVLYAVRGDEVHVLHVRHGARAPLPPQQFER